MSEQIQHGPERIETGANRFQMLEGIWAVEVHPRGDIEVTPIVDYLARALAAVRRRQEFAWAIVAVRGNMSEAQTAARALKIERRMHSMAEAYDKPNKEEFPI